MPLRIQLECGCRIEFLDENMGKWCQCKCGNSTYVPYDIWYFFNSDLDLEDVFQVFSSRFPTEKDDFRHDGENAWEWFDGNTTEGDIGFNISRKHTVSRSDPENPVKMGLFLYEGSPAPSELGQWLANNFGKTVTSKSPGHLFDATYFPE
ncbi:hypothetical protein GC163_16405 [bacterium]|nr:hypothetical protein [bacterium]